LVAIETLFVVRCNPRKTPARLVRANEPRLRSSVRPRGLAGAREIPGDREHALDRWRLGRLEGLEELARVEFGQGENCPSARRAMRPLVKLRSAFAVETSLLAEGRLELL